MADKYHPEVLQLMAEEVLDAVKARDPRVGDLLFQIAIKSGLCEQEVADQISQLAAGAHPEQRPRD
jgi:hypothetical protein